MSKPPFLPTCFGLVINQLDNSVLANPRGPVNVSFFEFPGFPGNTVVHERNLLEKLSTHWGRTGMGGYSPALNSIESYQNRLLPRFPGARSYSSAAVLQSCGWGAIHSNTLWERNSDVALFPVKRTLEWSKILFSERKGIWVTAREALKRGDKGVLSHTSGSGTTGFNTDSGNSADISIDQKRRMAYHWHEGKTLRGGIYGRVQEGISDHHGGSFSR